MNKIIFLYRKLKELILGKYKSCKITKFPVEIEAASCRFFEGERIPSSKVFDEDTNIIKLVEFIINDKKKGEKQAICIYMDKAKLIKQTNSSQIKIIKREFTNKKWDKSFKKWDELLWGDESLITFTPTISSSPTATLSHEIFDNAMLEMYQEKINKMEKDFDFDKVETKEKDEEW